MISIKVGNRTFELFGSIQELPITRYKLMQQYLLQDSGIGNTVQDFDHHFSNVITLLQSSSVDDAIQELTNMRYNFFSVISGLDFKCMAFACMVNKIGNKVMTDISTGGLAKIVDLLSNSGMAADQLQEHWESVKKKLIPSYQPTSLDISEVTSSTLKT